jgi:ATP-dependent RNA helicase RhlE
VRTKHGANNLAKQLERDGISSTAIHGDKSQPQRTQALEEFKQGEVRVLVATDVAARGLDIEDLPHVTNFELPNTPEDYIHRIGRTGRAGTKGWATSLVCDDENELLEGIEKLIKVKLTKELISGFEPGAKDGSVKPTSKPNEKERRGHTKEKVNDTHTNNKKSLEFDSKKRIYSKEKLSKEPQDPLFSQPYVPTTATSPTQSKSEPETTAVASLSLVKNKPDSHPRNQRKEKPIPALFLPISTNSPKQNE